jgi:hypothetical protein
MLHRDKPTHLWQYGVKKFNEQSIFLNLLMRFCNVDKLIEVPALFEQPPGKALDYGKVE